MTVVITMPPNPSPLHRLTLPTGEACSDWQRDLTAGLTPPDRLTDSFSHAFHAWCREESGDDLHQTLVAGAVRPAGAELASYKAEVRNWWCGRVKDGVRDEVMGDVR